MRSDDPQRFSQVEPHGSSDLMLKLTVSVRIQWTMVEAITMKLPYRIRTSQRRSDESHTEHNTACKPLINHSFSQARVLEAAATK